jgi:hypothetical protein
VTGEAQILPGTLDLLIPALLRLREVTDGWNRLAAAMACALAARPEEI